MSTRYQIPADVVFTDLSGDEGREGVLLNVATRRYYSLNETGLVLYERLAAGDSAEAAALHLTSVFEVDPETARASAARLVEALTASGLLQAAAV